MSYSKVKDSSIINRLNQQASKKVEDPNILSRLNKEEEPQEESYTRDILSGLAEGGHGLINTPHDIAKIAENHIPIASEVAFGLGGNPIEKYLLNKLKGAKLANKIPHQEEHNFAEELGQKGEPSWTHQLTQTLSKYAPELIGGAAAYRELPIALTRRGASRHLRQAQQLARERNINNLNIPNHIIEDARQFLPTTRPYQQLLEDATHGGYDSAFALQSDLGRASRGFSNSPFSFAERRHGREAGRTREGLLNHMRQELTNQGHADIAHLKQRGQQVYRNYNRIRPARNIGLAIAASQTPYGKRLLKALGIID